VCVAGASRAVLTVAAVQRPTLLLACMHVLLKEDIYNIYTPRLGYRSHCGHVLTCKGPCGQQHEARHCQPAVQAAPIVLVHHEALPI
jgi:hypothetical protein